MEILNWLSEGTIPYHKAWDRQRERVQLRAAGEVPDALILLEHAPVVSYGKAADPKYRLLTDEEYAERGIELVASDRGGDATYHGPGQLVGYPIVHLGEGNRDIHRYVRSLEEVVIRTAADFGVEAGRVDWHAGVWTPEGGYLAAVGVKVSRWVTHHGFALNVNAQVCFGFETIVPCGQRGREIVTLSGLAGREIGLSEVADAVTIHAADIFGSMPDVATEPGQANRR